jgi:hypothetical protein
MIVKAAAVDEGRTRCGKSAELERETLKRNAATILSDAMKTLLRTFVLFVIA